MAQFKFKLEPVLRQRRREEEQKQRDLAALVRRKVQLESQLRDEQQTIRDDKLAMADRMVGAVDVDRIRQHAAHVHHVTVHAQQIAWELVGLNREVEAAREALMEAVKQRKAVERLKERRYQRWQREQQRREQAETDEMAMQSYNRRREGVS